LEPIIHDAMGKVFGIYAEMFFEPNLSFGTLFLILFSLCFSMNLLKLVDVYSLQLLSSKEYQILISNRTYIEISESSRYELCDFRFQKQNFQKNMSRFL
jgi:hypothetical protein